MICKDFLQSRILVKTKKDRSDLESRMEIIFLKQGFVLPWKKKTELKLALGLFKNSVKVEMKSRHQEVSKHDTTRQIKWKRNVPFCRVSSKMTSCETKSIVFDQSENDSNSNLDLMKSILAREGKQSRSTSSSWWSNNWIGSNSRLTLTRSILIRKLVHTSSVSGG